jgi:hexokinase
MSDPTVFIHLEALEHAKQTLRHWEQKLEELVNLDVEKSKASLTKVVDHFQKEITRLKALIPGNIVAHIEEGVPPQIAVQLSANGTPTRAEQVASSGGTPLRSG